METFGERVTRLRTQRFKTRKAADRATGVPEQTWKNIEKLGTDPRLSTVTRIRDALGVSISELLDGVTVPDAEPAGPVPSEPPEDDTPPAAYRPRRTRGAR